MTSAAPRPLPRVRHGPGAVGGLGLRVTLREQEIRLSSQGDDREVVRVIDQAIAASGLRVTLRASLRKFPGCTHWHVKRGPEAGTLEITYWPQQRRAWFSVQSGRQAEWVEESMGTLADAIRRWAGDR